MKVSITFLLVCFFAQFSIGQKVIRKTIINPENQAIQLNTNNCYRVI